MFSPAKAEKHTLIFDVYAGGIHGLEAELTIDTNPAPGRYDLSLYAHTRGWLGSLVPWEGTFESNGWEIQPGLYKPQTHRSITTWREETQTKTYSFAKDGTFKSLAVKEHDKPEVTKDIPERLAYQAKDVLTATLNTMITMQDGESCETETDVFDGKRRFQMRFNFLGEADPKTSQYNVMENVAQKCTVEVVPDGGAWHKKPRGWLSIQEQGRNKGTMPTIWFTPIEEGGLYLPGKIMVQTDYGALIAHLSEYRQGDVLLIADKRK